MHLSIHTFMQTDPRWADCRAIRQQVFVTEQQVPIALEWDAQDAVAIHLLACWQQTPVGCARVLPDGHIGRMAVLARWRKQGVGSQLLSAAIAVCRSLGVDDAVLSAQVHAQGFYTRAGFIIESAPYVDANILHVDMRRKLV